MKAQNNILISPSILAADFAKIGEEVINIAEAGADMIHLDVMDGDFVPNLTFGMPVIQAIRPYTDLPFDVHLMMNRVEEYIPQFINSGANYVTFHMEATTDPLKIISMIKDYGAKAGLSMMPQTDIELIFPYLHMLDLVLIMTVQPGFGGQEFMHNQLAKITKLSHEVKRCGYDLIISVDGGINRNTAPLAIASGANMLVAGSSIFQSQNRRQAITDLRSIGR